MDEKVRFMPQNFTQNCHIYFDKQLAITGV